MDERVKQLEEEVKFLNTKFCNHQVKPIHWMLPPARMIVTTNLP